MQSKFTFTVLSRGVPLPGNSRRRAYLIEDDWDDFSYRTTFYLIVFDSDGQQYDIGDVKIGHSSSRHGKVNIPASFTRLEDSFFSLGQNYMYYKTLFLLEDTIRRYVLDGLRDVVNSHDSWIAAMKYDVTKTSLLRAISSKSVTGQFRRLLRGGARTTRFSFRFVGPPRANGVWPTPPLSFDVEPDSIPPTNVHALIGQNGVGKSRLLNIMAKSLLKNSASPSGHFEPTSDVESDEKLFASVVSVSFSAFDDFNATSDPKESEDSIKYFYIGLATANEENKPGIPKTPKELAREFSESVKACSLNHKIDRWRLALASLESDSLFNEAGITRLADNSPEKSISARTLFRSLSAGHKIVLLTITKLVELVEEQTLVLMDEPEAHLHPPLLSAFVRALSLLLIDRNAVALVATHSPVVLQEVPASCVWVMRRRGRSVRANRPEIETFGENVGVLTREVFRLEANQSGFHQLLSEAIIKHPEYEDALEFLGGSLGAEGRAVLRAMSLANQERNQ